MKTLFKLVTVLAIIAQLISCTTAGTTLAFDDEKTDSNYSLSTKKKETKGDSFDKVFDDDKDDLPF